MENTSGRSASNNDSPKDTDDKSNTKITNKEIREEYFNKLRSWLTTVNSYECYYNKLQQELLQNNYQQFLKGSSTEVPRDISNDSSETPTVGSNQFEGISYA